MKYLIINADDFGYSLSVNRGIIKGHVDGIVTSTSVMVDAVGADQAVELIEYPELSVGLHFVINDFDNLAEELQRQYKKFTEITGIKPDHLNSHKIYTEDKRIYSALADFANSNNMPLRRFNPAKFIDSFFGPHSNGDVSTASLIKAVDQATDDYNEIMCHVGYSDDYLRQHSSYNDLRETELLTVCDPSVNKYIEGQDIKLINWRSLALQS